LKLYDPLIDNVIEQHKLLLLQANHDRGDLDAAAAKLFGELGSRRLGFGELVSLHRRRSPSGAQGHAGVRAPLGEAD
jgi:hypothetical protein